MIKPPPNVSSRALATRLAAVALAVAGLAACPGARDESVPDPPIEPPPAGNGGSGGTGAIAGPVGGGGGGSGGTGGTTAADGPAPAEPTPPGPAGACPDGFHRCGETCASNNSLTTCGSGCEPCPTIADGVATCDGTRCGISCPADRRPCLDRCISASQPCDSSCPPGRNPCNGICVEPTSVTACGTACTACPMSPNGKTSCDGLTCALACNDGHYLCEPTGSCNPFAQACRRGEVDTCAPGYRLCGSKCLVETACCTEGQEGCSECQTCSGTPGRCMNRPDGAGCGSDRACRSGACVSCRTSGSCGASNACRTGQYQCSAGVESCRESNQANGTRCGGQNACFNGACRQCRDSGECSDNPCVSSSWQCSNGVERCVEMGSRRGGQRACPSRDDVCIRGRCTRCRNSGSCTFEFEPECKAATWQCFGEDGGEQCTFAGNRPQGTSCSGGQCDNFGLCVRP